MIFIGLTPMKKAPHPFANDENHTSNVGCFASAQTRPQMIYTGIFIQVSIFQRHFLKPRPPLVTG
jgi:hypothetical protein